MRPAITPSRWRRASRLFAWALLISFLGLTLAVTFGVQAPSSSGPGGETTQGPALAIIVSVGALFVSALGTASTVLLGWRSDQRQAVEAKLKIEQLELQLEQARRERERETASTETNRAPSLGER